MSSSAPQAVNRPDFSSSLVGESREEVRSDVSEGQWSISESPRDSHSTSTPCACPNAFGHCRSHGLHRGLRFPPFPHQLVTNGLAHKPPLLLACLSHLENVFWEIAVYYTASCHHLVTQSDMPIVNSVGICASTDHCTFIDAVPSLVSQPSSRNKSSRCCNIFRCNSLSSPRSILPFMVAFSRPSSRITRSCLMA